VSFDVITRVAAALGVSLDYLMIGREKATGAAELQIPASLAKFADDARLTFRQALTLLEMQRQIVAHRSATKKESLDKVDWRKFYECVKDYLRE